MQEEYTAEFIPDWFDPWFVKIFRQETVTPSYIIRKLNLNKNIVYNSLYSGELEAFLLRGRWIIPVNNLRFWLLENLNSIK